VKGTKNNEPTEGERMNIESEKSQTGGNVRNSDKDKSGRMFNYASRNANVWASGRLLISRQDKRMETFSQRTCGGESSDKLTEPHLLNKSLIFYGNRRLITAFTTAHHLSLSSAKSIRTMPLVKGPF
jgi:hypothetical protein